ncbi:hypothetical protein E5Q_05238 [Mixia osmundae IAM 14324]|uniref:GDP-mannose 4,6 dehydratase n=1 Tax=Mixia osmundae (strain CBS 9802 / IAM 14324 / JCM 22182 / KY 12970) TaxID=764103 RepID=G7E6U1_MIXOS|nr:hypothetical protein E5Q_05238 [Mixia osmundae IAM 14324]
MSNTTARNAVSIHGTNPQFLIETTIRYRIWDSNFWKEHCFALTAESIIDRAVALNYIGGTYGASKPTDFLSLTLKMLQIQPSKEIVLEYLRAEEFKYLRALAIFYIRLTFDAMEVYEILEPLLEDYRKLRYRQLDGSYSIMTIDAFVDSLLTEERVCEIQLPRLTLRRVLEETESLPSRKSQLGKAMALDDLSDDEAPRRSQSDESDRYISRSPTPEEDEVRPRYVSRTPTPDDDDEDRYISRTRPSSSSSKRQTSLPSRSFDRQADLVMSADLAGFAGGKTADASQPITNTIETTDEAMDQPSSMPSDIRKAQTGHKSSLSLHMHHSAASPFDVGSKMDVKEYRSRKVALLTGITGQDGSYLTELLLEKGYEVHGIIRRSSSFNTGRIEHIYKDPHERPNMVLHYGDLADTTNLVYIVSTVKPTEIYNLAAQSHVKVSFDMAEYTGDVDGLGTLRLLDAIRTCGLTNHIRFYQASTSELYGKVVETPQTEKTPFYPRSPYGVAKLYAFWIVKNYRESYGMHASNGILFNHESPRRGRTFVTRKISRAVAEIVIGTQDCLYLGNLDAKRDWGHAKDYVEGMWRMLQQDQPDDFVLATGETHPVREFVEKAFKHGGIDITWEGKGVEEVGKDKKTGKVIVRVDPIYFRPAEVELLWGMPTKAEKELGWKRKVDFEDLVKEMVEEDLKGARVDNRD